MVRFRLSPTASPIAALLLPVALAGCGTDDSDNAAAPYIVATGEPAPTGAVHTIPARARDHAGLVRMLDADARTAAETTGRQGAWRSDWRVTGETERILALAAEQVRTRDARTRVTTRALLWDKRRDRSLTAARLFVDPVAARKLLADADCAALDVLRAERQGFERGRAPCPQAGFANLAFEARAGQPFGHVTRHVEARALGEDGADYRVRFALPEDLIPLIRSEYRAEFTAPE